jgi:type 1 glutamine amidotransferase
MEESLSASVRRMAFGPLVLYQHLVRFDLRVLRTGLLAGRERHHEERQERSSHCHRVIIATVLAIWALAAALLGSVPSQSPTHILVFSRTAAYRHQSIADAVRALEDLGAGRGWKVTATEDAGAFDDENLDRFEVVVFLMTTGDVLDPSQQAAFERFMAKRKGYVGIHSAADTEYDWPFYGRLVGAYFRVHPEIQEARYRIEDRNHPATAHLPESWRRTDEHYNFRANPRESGARVLVSIDETSYEPGEGAMGDHPVVWCRELDGGGRSFYTALGHTEESWSDPLFLQHLEGAIDWAASSP